MDGQELTSGYKLNSRLMPNDPEESIEQAITDSQKLLLLIDQQNSPVIWAIIIMNLGNAYYARIRGDRGKNVEQAIVYYRQVLRVLIQSIFPVEWVMIMNNLATAYSQRTQGKRSTNLKQAIACYHKALQVAAYHNLLLEWALILNNLAIAYLEGNWGKPEVSIKAAITCYKKVLTVITRKNSAIQWATTQMNLANAYYSYSSSNRGKNLKKAITGYKKALTVITLEAFPVQWATLMMNLGNAYQACEYGDRAQNVEKAISAYRSALKIRTPGTLPQDCLQTAYNLGNLGFREQLWEIAIEGYTLAIAAVEQLHTWIMDDEEREKIQSEAAEVYANLVQTYIHLNQCDQALEVMERSRSRRLVELIATATLYAEGRIPREIKQYVEDFHRLQKQINDLQRSENSASFINYPQYSLNPRQQRVFFEPHTQEIALLEAQKQAVWSQRRSIERSILSQMSAPTPNFAAMQALLQGQPRTAVLYFFSIPEHTYIVIIRPDQIPQYHVCLHQGIEHLQGWIFDQWIRLYIDDRKTWATQMPAFLAELATRLQLNQLVETDLKDIQELIVIPHLNLHQIPFAALPLYLSASAAESKVQCLGDRFRLRTLSSYQLLQVCSQRPVTTENPAYATISDTRNDLPFSGFEAAQVAQELEVPAMNQLQGKTNTTLENFRILLLEKQVQFILLSLHAYCRLDNPLMSAFCLGDGDFTLGELLSPIWQLPHLQEVILAGCETGLGHSKNLTDDILTLADGFLYAGARGVISSLWVVNDVATALFSIFYHRQRKLKYDRPTALQAAQRQLRELSGTELRQEFAEKLKTYFNDRIDQALAQGDEKMGRQLMKIMQFRLPDYYRDPAPFAAPEYWAAFVCQGLA